MVHQNRIRNCNQAPLNPDGEYVLYWMIANRRVNWNLSLERALEHATQLNKPLLIFESLRCGHQWASARIVRFVLDGMADNYRQLKQGKAHYFPYVEPKPGAGSGLLPALAKHACVVVTDDFPCFFLPQMIEAAARRSPVQVEKIDANGLLPMRAADKIYKRAVDFRRFLQHTLPFYLTEFIHPDPLAGATVPKLENLPSGITERWPLADPDWLTGEQTDLRSLPVDHDVPPISLRGGAKAAERALGQFLKSRLANYDEHRSQPEKEGASGFSPYLHFGHLSVHQVFKELAKQEDWSPDQLGGPARGARTDWWGMSANAEAFLDELVTWRELGFNFCWQHEDYDQYESLPEWARKTLEEHAGDPREYVYSLAEFEQAQTHDPLWNAAQTQLVREGRIHNYLRMLWGKKILEWTPSPREALAIMIELNNKYAIDGRDPNSYSGIFWTLGRYDRPWAPDRPIFGKVRYMSSENTARKFKVKNYIQKYTAPQSQLF